MAGPSLRGPDDCQATQTSLGDHIPGASRRYDAPGDTGESSHAHADERAFVLAHGGRRVAQTN
jgi:hypothetical protein